MPRKGGEGKSSRAHRICNFNKWETVAKIYLTFKLPNVFGFWHLTLYLCTSFMSSSQKTTFLYFPLRNITPGRQIDVGNAMELI